MDAMGLMFSDTMQAMVNSHFHIKQIKFADLFVESECSFDHIENQEELFNAEFLVMAAAISLLLVSLKDEFNRT